MPGSIPSKNTGECWAEKAAAKDNLGEFPGSQYIYVYPVQASTTTLPLPNGDEGNRIEPQDVT